MGAMDSEGTGRGRRDTLIVVGLLAVALLWRVVFFVEMQASPYADHLTLDSEVYQRAALEVAAGQWSADTTFFQAPLYPWVLGAVYALFGPSQTIAKLLQILISVASCWLVYRIAGRAFDRTVAQVALAISAVYGMYLYFSNELLAVTTVVFLDLLGLDLLMRAREGDRRARWAAAGIVFGFSTIARPTILPFVAAVCCWAVIAGWRSGSTGKAFLSALVFAAGVALPIAPVTLHNWLADGDLVLIAANGGFNFYIGNNPASDGVTAAAPGVRPDRGGAEADQARFAREALGETDATPKEISDYWYGRAWSYIRSDPRWAIRHTAYKVFILFNAHEVSNNRVIEFATRHSTIFTRATVSFWLVVPLAVAGAVLGGGSRLQTTLLLLFVTAYSATVVPFFVNARFRMPVVAILIIFAAAAVVTWVLNLRERRFGPHLWLSIAAAVVTAVVIRPLPALRAADAQSYFNEAEAYRAQGDFASAAAWYQKALDAYPGYCDAAYNLARIHTEVVPDPQRVIAVLEPVVEACAEDVGIRELLGRALCAVGRRGEGEAILAVVTTRNPQGGVP